MPELASLQICTGCGACVDACAKGAIRLVEDADGFAFPQVSAETCIGCGRCGAVCPALRTGRRAVAAPSGYPRYFAAQLRDREALWNVSSGGAFWALAQTVVNGGGVVYGAVQEEVGRVRHRRAETLSDIAAMRRSKYLPSEAVGCYRAVRQDLTAGRRVLFTGTGCQIAALQAFLGEPSDHLATCEVICHGVPSPAAWRSYRSEKEASVGKRMTGFSFRDKSLGWKKTQYEIRYADGSVERERITTQPFHQGYLKGLFSRESCGRCPFAALPRRADLSLADFWRYRGRLSAGDIGVSLVSVGTPAGAALLKDAEAMLDVEEVSAGSAAASCRHLTQPPLESPFRAAFLARLKDTGYHAAVAAFLGKKPNPKRGLRARIRGKLRSWLKPRKPAFVDRPEDVSRHAALEDAFLLLARRKVAVYYCNRVGEEKTPGWAYADSAVRRMIMGLSFPVMSADPERYAADFRELLGASYSPERVAELAAIPRIVEIGGQCRHADGRGPCVNVVGGLRVTCGQPARAGRTLHVYGRCGAFGYAVTDAETLPSALQRELIARGYADVRVVNHGLWGADGDRIETGFLQDVAGFREGDAVLFYLKHPHPCLIGRWAARGLRYFDITHAWHRDPIAKNCFYDKPGHMTAAGYALAARLVADELTRTGLSCGPVSFLNRLRRVRPAAMNAFLKSRGGADLDAEIARYVEAVRAEYPGGDPSRKTGAIVMNCNPFTNGHRYLIERAASEVDCLYVFVVEEDKSRFRFEDRFEMVRRGVADLANVAVVPSGRFMISSLTFPEYFLKDQVREKEFDVSGDVKTFCERIAPAFNISVRFAGEEPFDPVTANYNDCMRRLLPQFGLTFREIPRLARAGSGAINATAVRRLLDERNWTALQDLVPETTLEILRAKYAEDSGETK